MQSDQNSLRQWMLPSDIFKLDRGYRDAIEYLERLGFKTIMPRYLPKGTKQHTAEEANESRLVTKTRWIVEARNGHIKSKFALLRNMMSPHHVPHIGDFVRIACAIFNAYCPPIQMTSATPLQAAKMLQLANTPNALQYMIEAEGFLDRYHGDDNWVPIDCFNMYFPMLSVQYLQDLTLGVYQLRLAKSYVQDKIQRESEYKIKLLLEEEGLLKSRIYSRFSGSKKYDLWISFRTQVSHENDEQLEEPILGWFCQCKSGARSLGCCAHIASVLWYLGHGRHERTLYPSSSLLTSVLDSANREIPDIIDE
jgi:hypothetical protein